MSLVWSVSWVILALVHVTPALALVRPGLLASLYGIDPASPLFLLMQHRAALFAGVVLACLWCALDEAPRRMGSVLVALSMLSFLWLWWQAGMPAGLRRIALVDAVGLLPLAVVLWGAWRS